MLGLSCSETGSDLQGTFLSSSPVVEVFLLPEAGGEAVEAVTWLSRQDTNLGGTQGSQLTKQVLCS